MWHSYGSGGGETGAFQKALGAILAANPDLKVNVVEQPFADIFTKWSTDVAAGGGPDMFIAPNDSLFAQADARRPRRPDDRARRQARGLQPGRGRRLQGRRQVLHGPRVPQGRGHVVRQARPSRPPPTTTDELLAGVKDGSIKLGLNQGVYHNFGFTGAFGGTLMDDTGKCIADQGGWADAYKYLADLKAAGAKFYTDGNALKQDFQTGDINAIVDGPWQTADFTQGPRRQARRRADARPAPPARQPADGHRRLVHQPQQPEPRPRDRRWPSSSSAPRASRSSPTTPATCPRRPA